MTVLRPQQVDRMECLNPICGWWEPVLRKGDRSVELAQRHSLRPDHPVVFTKAEEPPEGLIPPAVPAATNEPGLSAHEGS